MKFPSRENKADQYRSSGYILGDTARNMGFPVPDSVVEAWGDTMARLSGADDDYEANPETFSSPEDLLDYLRLSVDNDSLLLSAKDLLEASSRSKNATKLEEHFDARAQEAISSLGLLRYQSPEAISEQNRLWTELGSLSVVGIYLDSLIDARKDSTEIEQFSAAQLTLGALRGIVRKSKDIQPYTWTSVMRAAHKHGLTTYVAGKPIRFIKRSMV